jgi:hypothetical protein
MQTSMRQAAAPPLSQPSPLRGKTEVLTCRDGSEDKHARIALVLVGGKADGFAYYSKWKPRTCSIYLRRSGDAYSRWSDSGSVANVNTEHGQFMIEHGKNEYRLVFRDVDRERYCGMDGTINGSLKIRKGSQSCEIVGIMEEGVPLGQAYAQLEQSATDVPSSAPQTTAAATATAAPANAEPSPLGFFARLVRTRSQSAFPSAAGLGD